MSLYKHSDGTFINRGHFWLHMHSIRAVDDRNPSLNTAHFDVFVYKTCQDPWLPSARPDQYSSIFICMKALFCVHVLYMLHTMLTVAPC